MIARDGGVSLPASYPATHAAMPQSFPCGIPFSGRSISMATFGLKMSSIELYGAKAHQRTEWLQCQACRGKTNHTLQYARQWAVIELELEDGTPREIRHIWLIWVCNGCGNLTFEDTAFYADWFEDPSAPRYKIAEYPNREIHRKNFKHIPDKINRIYQETVEAFNNRLDVLCATGLRSLMEGICDDMEKSSKHDSLEKKIESQ
jgi:hypothetical protein